MFFYFCSQKNEFETAPECVLDNIQYLIMAIVYRSLRLALQILYDSSSN